MIRKSLYTILMLLTCSLASAQSLDNNTQLSVMRELLCNVSNHTQYISNEDFKTMIIIPTNDGMLSYIDPCSYKSLTLANIWEIKYNDNGKLMAAIYECEYNGSTNRWEKLSDTPIKTINSSIEAFRERTKHLLRNIIIKGDYVEGQFYYKTMNNMIVRIDGVDVNSNIYGPYQMENNAPLKIIETFVENGCRYLVVDGPIMGSRKPVNMLLADKPELSKFSEIVQACCIHKNLGNNHASTPFDGEGNLSYYQPVFSTLKKAKPQYYKRSLLFDRGNHTIYAPTNAAMEEAFAKGLPTLDHLSAAEKYDAQLAEMGEVGDSALKIIEVMADFVRYHIQDFSIMIDKNTQGGKYNTAKNIFVKETMLDNIGYEYEGYNVTGRTYRLNVEASESSLKVTDALGNKRKVIKENGLYNMVCTEYWVRNINYSPTNSIATVSTVVVHAIDGPLLFSDDQFIFECKEAKYYKEQ